MDDLVGIGWLQRRRYDRRFEFRRGIIKVRFFDRDRIRCAVCRIEVRCRGLILTGIAAFVVILIDKGQQFVAFILDRRLR
ncbi:hypothetical protein D3C80_1575580 [compost metagenome]